MIDILDFLSGLGEVLILITPMMLIIGIINAIKKNGNESTFYKIMAIISAYLIFIPLIINN
jgi:hypothetical protein